MINLRPYQQDAIDNIKAAGRNHKRILLTLPCGAGKTMIMAHMAEQAQLKGNSTWIVLPRKEIYEQTLEVFDLNNIPLNMIYVGMAITTANRLDILHPPKMIIIDETHLAMASTYQKIIAKYPDAIIIGLTASPVRTDNKPLGDLYTTLIQGVSVQWLIDNQYLSPYKYYSVTVADLSELKRKGSDYDLQQATSVLDKAKIYGDVIQNWRKYANNKQTVIYCTSIKHSKKTAEMFKQAGIKAEHFDGTTSNKKRTEIIEKFRRGEITVLCNCDLISMGFDMPDIECVVLLRPTQSAALYIQQTGRPLRYKPGKTAIIIDHVGNYQKFGLPNEDREWSLTQPAKIKPKYDENGQLYVRQCLNCYGTFDSKQDICPYCGTIYIHTRTELKHLKEIKMQEIKEYKRSAALKKVANLTNIKQCKTKDEIYAFCELKGYNPKYGYFELKRRGWLK